MFSLTLATVFVEIALSVGVIGKAYCEESQLLPSEEAIIGFWKLDKEFRLTGHGRNATLLAPVIDNANPVFLPSCGNDIDGCFSVETQGPLVRYNNLTNFESFTIGLWFNFSGKNSYSGMFNIGDKYSASYETNTGTVWLLGPELDRQNGPLLSLCCFPRRTWTYVAFSVNKTGSWADIQGYSHTDTVGFRRDFNSYFFSSKEDLLLTTNDTTWLELGSDTFKLAYMTEQDHLACVLFYEEAFKGHYQFEMMPKACLMSEYDREQHRYGPKEGPYFITPQSLIDKRADKEKAEQLNKTIKHLLFGPSKPRILSSNELIAEMNRCMSYFSAGLYTPYRTLDEPLTMNIRLTIQGFNGISTTDQSVAVTATVMLNWRVDGCQRPQSDNVLVRGNSELVPATLQQKAAIWTPILRFISAANSDIYMDKVPKGDQLQIRRIVTFLNENTTFEFDWMREGSFVAYCMLNLNLFPFDTQICNFTFTLNREIEYVMFNDNDTEFFINARAFGNTEWRLLATETSLGMSTFGMTNVSAMIFSAKLQRIPDFYIQNLFAPSFVLGVVEIGIFMLPPDCDTRSAFTVTIVLAFTVAQSAVVSQIPKVPQRNLLNSYVQMMEWWSASLALYALVMILLIRRSFCSKKISDKVVLIVDIISAVAAFSAFVAINCHFMVNLS